MINDLEVKYRPSKLSEIVGQKHITETLQKLYKLKKLPHKIMFYGPAGVGKTSLGRILGKLTKCSVENMIEIDAASNNGVDYIKKLKNTVQYSSLSETPNKLIIIDEIQRLSAQAFDALLKLLEEPPDHVYFVLCTTEFSKVPETIRSRCKKFKLQEVSYDEIVELVSRVASIEEIDLSESALKLIARNANGCPREALSCLDQCRACESKEEVSKILASHVSSADVITLCRYISSGKGYTFQDIQKVLEILKEKNPESVRIQVSNYLVACVMSAKSKDSMMRFGDILFKWSQPITSTQGFSEIVLNTLSSI